MTNGPTKLKDIEVFTENPFNQTIELRDDVVIEAPVTVEVWYNGVNQPSVVVTPTVVGQVITFGLSVAQLRLLPAKNASINVKFDDLYVIQQKVFPTKTAALPTPVVDVYTANASIVYRVSFYSDATNAALAQEALDDVLAAKVDIDLAIEGINEVVTRPEINGAVGDGVTDDTAEILATIDPGREVLLTGEYLVTALDNKYGVDFEGPGRIVKSITGGLQQLNTYADKNQHIIGQEYLYHLINKLRTRSAGTIIKVVMAGDSTTVGVGTTADGVGAGATGTLQWYLGRLCEAYGIADIQWVNDGVSSSATNQWIASKLTAQLAMNPDVMFVRFGINDPTQGRNLDWFLDDLDLGLSTIRASKTIDQTSIVLFTPNTVSDTPNGRDEKWFEQINHGIKALARKYQCAFIDTYALWQDSRNGAAGKWLDDPLTSPSGRGIHPNDDFNAWITTVIFDLMFPKGIRVKLGAFEGVANQLNSIRSPAVTDLPNTYNAPITISRAASGWPLGGVVITVKQADGIWRQDNYPYLAADGYKPARYRYSSGTGGTAWSPWMSVGISAPTSAVYKPANSLISHPEVLAYYEVATSDGYPENGFLKVSRNSDGSVAQELFSTQSPANKVWLRSTYFNGSTYVWTPWRFSGIWTPTRAEKTMLASDSDVDPDYLVSETIFEVLSSDGWPISGKLVTHKNAAGAVTQKLTSTTQAFFIEYSRNTYYDGSTTVWTPWAISGAIQGGATYNPTAISTGTPYVVTTLSVPGAVVGKIVNVAFSIALPDDVKIDAWVSAADSVKVRFHYIGLTSVDLGSGTIYYSINQ